MAVDDAGSSTIALLLNMRPCNEDAVDVGDADEDAVDEIDINDDKVDDPDDVAEGSEEPLDETVVVDEAL